MDHARRMKEKIETNIGDFSVDTSFIFHRQHQHHRQHQQLYVLYEKETYMGSGASCRDTASNFQIAVMAGTTCTDFADTKANSKCKCASAIE